MPLRLPKLDDRSWKDLTEEGRLLIPTVAPAWTNHNVSDPGITLTELFAYYCESFLYRVDQVSDANVREFLKLIKGPEWKATESIGNDVRNTRESLKYIHRAVAPADFEHLALTANTYLPDRTSRRVARAKCVPRRDLQRTGQGAAADAPGHVSLVIVPDPVEGEIAPLIRAVQRVIEPARLLATRVHVVPPRYVSVSVRLSIMAEPHVMRQTIRQTVIEALQRFFHPLTGGPEGTGWPFGRNVYVSEIYRLLTRVPGVHSVKRVLQDPEGAQADELVVNPTDSARLRRNRAGDLEAVHLEADELVKADLHADDITIVSAWSTPTSERAL